RRKVVFAAAAIVLVAAAAVVALAIGLGGGEPAPRAAASPAAGPTTSATPTVSPFDAGVPQRLRIDGIGVEAPVLAMGTAPDGSQEVPVTLTDTSWWRHGAHPGTAGNTVITGHAAHKPTDDGVFDDLGTLEPGDEFEVIGENGVVTYTVTGSEEVDTANFGDYADRIYSSEGQPGAVLMTCGSWNGQVWESTTIVWADMSGSLPAP